MTEVLDHTPATVTAADLIAEVHRVLAASSEPQTVSKIRSHLPTAHRSVDPKELEECLVRLVDANVLYQYPKYRSQHYRYWDRSMRVHIASVLKELLHDEPLAWPQLRRKLPGYIEPDQAQAILEEEHDKGHLHLHPAVGQRAGKRYGVEPPDPREYLRAELPALFERLHQLLGISPERIRGAALELLHDEEWRDATPPRLPAAAPLTVMPGTMLAHAGEEHNSTS
jgi:hypothetical protein